MRVRAPEKQLWAARSEFSLAARNLARQAKKGYELAAEDQECFLGVLPRSAVREMAQNQMADFWQKNEVILRE